MTRRRIAEISLLALVMAVAFTMRYARTGWDSISLDEYWHLALSAGRGSPQLTLPRDTLLENLPSMTGIDGAPPWYSVWTHMQRVIHPPLYPQTLRLWRHAVGEGDVAAQWLSGICSLAAVLLLWHAARTAFGVPIGLWAAALMAVAPTQVFMAQEVRGYPLLLMLGCWCLGIAARIDKHGLTRGRAAELGACMLGMMLTHYFAAGACLGIVAWAIVRTRGSRRTTILAAVATAALVYAVIWGPWAWQQRLEVAITGDPWLRETRPNAGILAVARFAAAPVRLIADTNYGVIGDANHRAAFWPILAGSLYVVPLLLLRRRPELWLWWLWLVGAVGFLLVLDLMRHTQQLLFIRYLLIASPAVYGLLMAALGSLRPVLFHTLAMAAVGMSFWLWPLAWFSDAPDFHMLQRLLRQRTLPGDVYMFAVGDFSRWNVEMSLLVASQEAKLFPRAVVMLSKPVDAVLASQLRGRRICLMSGPMTLPIDALFPGATQLDELILVDHQDRFFIGCTWIQMP